MAETDSTVRFIDTLIERIENKEKLVSEEALLRQKRIRIKIISVEEMYEQAEQTKIASLMSKIQQQILQNRDELLVGYDEIPYSKISELQSAGYKIRKCGRHKLVVYWCEPHEFMVRQYGWY